VYGGAEIDGQLVAAARPEVRVMDVHPLLDAGIVDQDVERWMGLSQPCGQSLPFLRPGQVAGKCHDLGKLLFGFVQRFRTPGADEDLASFGGEQLGNAEPDSRRTAGNKNRMTLELHVTTPGYLNCRCALPLEPDRRDQNINNGRALFHKNWTIIGTIAVPAIAPWQFVSVMAKCFIEEAQVLWDNLEQSGRLRARWSFGMHFAFSTGILLHARLTRRRIMERVRWEEHKGRKILVIDYSNLRATKESEKAQILDCISAARAIVAETKGRILFLSYVHESSLDKEIMTALKDFAAYTNENRFVEKECVVGISALQKMFVNTINLFSKAKLVIFDDVLAAKEWLTA
jgi:hypothetical protein